MHSPKPPAPDPAIAAAQAAEQRRAEAGQVSQTQHGLNADTIALRRRFGIMAAGVGATGAASYASAPGSVPGITASPSGGGSGFLIGPSFGTAGGGKFSELQNIA